MDIAEVMLILRVLERATPLVVDLWNGDRERITRRELTDAFNRADAAERAFNATLSEEEPDDGRDAEETEGTA